MLETTIKISRSVKKKLLTMKQDDESYNDFIKLNGESACRDAGKLRQEGKDYKVKDGDVINFLFNV